MRKVTAVLFIIVMIFVFSNSLLADDFRSVNWGMSKQQVKENEDAELYEEEEKILFYETSLKDYDFLLGYFFQDDKLFRTKYVMLESFYNDNKYLNVKDEFLKILRDKYGTTDGDMHAYWTNDLYKGDYEDYGTAVGLGHLSYFYKWNTDKADIWLGLTGDGNFNITFGIEYVSTEYSHLADKYQEEEQNKTSDNL